jgi:hypothetical protein
MKLWRYVFMFVAVGLFIAAEPALWAQQAASLSAMRIVRYDKSTEVATSGTIQSIQAQADSTLPKGAYVTLLAPPLTLNVQIGALSAAKAPFKVGDQVQITGSIVTINGKQVLLARQIQTASETITVRSLHGLVIKPDIADQTQGGQQ